MQHIEKAEEYPSRVPPPEVAVAAERGLKLRTQFRRGGTMAAIARARDLKNRRPLSEQTMRRMIRYFKRLKSESRAENFGNEENPSTGYIAWLLWGGDAGKAWAEEHKQAMEKAKSEARTRRFNRLG